MTHNETPFSYTYSSAEQEEIKRIRQKYDPPTKKPDTVEQLRRMDAAVTGHAIGIALTVGIIGTLTMGGGMSLIMTDLGSSLGMAIALPFGIAIGLIGIALCLSALPIYRHTLKKGREKIAPEVLRLTDELLK